MHMKADRSRVKAVHLQLPLNFKLHPDSGCKAFFTGGRYEIQITFGIDGRFPGCISSIDNSYF